MCADVRGAFSGAAGGEGCGVDVEVDVRGRSLAK